MFLRLASAALLLAATAVTASADTWNTRPATDWSGPYIGLNVGGLRTDGRVDRAGYGGDLITLDVENGLFPPNLSETDVSAMGGFAVGYNWQQGAWVGGIEADFSFARSSVTLRFSEIDPNPNPVFNGLDTITHYTTELDNLASLRMRLGYAIDRTLLYATGGLAAGRVTNRFTLDLPGLGYSSPDWSARGTRLGYVIGAGVEQRLSDRISVKVEAMHYDLQDVTVRGSDPAVFPGERLNYRFRNSGQVGRIGVNVRF